jgi:hypothetical protein
VHTPQPGNQKNRTCSPLTNHGADLLLPSETHARPQALAEDQPGSQEGGQEHRRAQPPNDAGLLG